MTTGGPERLTGEEEEKLEEEEDDRSDRREGRGHLDHC